MTCSVAPDYTWEFSVASYDVGADRRLRPSSQLRYQQEVGERHLSTGGLDYAELYRHGLVFVLTRTQSVITRAPRFHETVRLTTWHRENRGAQFFRCYRFADSDDQTLIESVTAFAIVDAHTHALLRPTVFDQFGLPSQPDRQSGCPDPRRLRAPQELTSAGTRAVRWSDIDCNGHVNNAVYADIACDALSQGLHGKRLTGFALNYAHEAVQGQQIALRTLQQAGDAWVSAACGDTPCFDAWLAWQPEPL